MVSPSWRAEEVLDSWALRLISVTLVMNAGKSPLLCIRRRSLVSVACSPSVRLAFESSAASAGGGDGAAAFGAGARSTGGGAGTGTGPASAGEGCAGKVG